MEGRALTPSVAGRAPGAGYRGHGPTDAFVITKGNYSGGIVKPESESGT